MINSDLSVQQKYLQFFHCYCYVLLKPFVVSEEVCPAIGYCLIQFLTHVIYIGRNGILNIILLPVKGRMDIDVPLLMQETICGLYAVLTYH